MSTSSSESFQRATQRPANVTKPAHWTNPPVPQPKAPITSGDPEAVDPTRFGDWTLNGIAVDF